MASMAVKVVQLEGLLQGKQAQLHSMGATGQAWLQDACRLRDAVASTLAALGTSACTPLLCYSPIHSVDWLLLVQALAHPCFETPKTHACREQACAAGTCTVTGGGWMAM